MLKIDINKFMLFFNKRTVFKYFKYYLALFSMFIIVEATTLHFMYLDTIKDYIKKIENIVDVEGTDLSLICGVVSCDTISNGEVGYKLNSSGYLTYTKEEIPKAVLLNTFTADLKTVIVYKDHVITINDLRYLETFKKILIINSLLFFILYTYAFVKQIYIESKNNAFEKTSYRIELENKLQRDITESAHHEMGMPLALIKTLIYDLYATLYPCDFSKSGICNMCTSEIDVDKSRCVDCKLHAKNIETEEMARKYFMKIKFGIERLEAPLNQMAASKHIKYSNGNTSLFTIIDNIVKTNNGYKVNKIIYSFNNEDIFKTHAVGYGMTNGDLLNIVHSHVTNSLEAKATSMAFSCALHADNKKIDIYIADNGRGIRDKSDNVVTTEDIFVYGYTTKDINGNPVSKSLIINFLEKIGIVKDSIVPRGAGLSVTKGIAVRSGGDVKLVSTSKNGTVFKLTIPVKLKRDD
jgi:signal transduction histidine kinase